MKLIYRNFQKTELIVLIWDYELSKYVSKVKFPPHIKQGWGLTHDPKTKRVYITNGSNKVFMCNINEDTYEFGCDEGNVVQEKLKSGAVRDLNLLNDLEFKDG